MPLIFFTRSGGAGVSNPDHAQHVSTVQPPPVDQPSISSHAASSVAHLVRVSSAGRDGTGSGKRGTPESSPGIKMFTRHNLTFSPVNTKPPMPPRSLNNNRSSSSETKRPIPKLDRSQRSSVSYLLGASNDTVSFAAARAGVTLSGALRNAGPCGCVGEYER